MATNNRRDAAWMNDTWIWCRVALVDATGAEVDEATPNAVAWGAAGARLLVGDITFPLRVNAPTLEVCDFCTPYRQFPPKWLWDSMGRMLPNAKG
jgi:hypothetical protein